MMDYYAQTVKLKAQVRELEERLRNAEKLNEDLLTNIEAMQAPVAGMTFQEVCQSVLDVEK